MSDITTYYNVARRDVVRVQREIAERFRAMVVVARMEHDDGCPCADGSHPWASCTCVTVNIAVEAVR